MSTIGWHTYLQSLVVVFLNDILRQRKVHFETRELVLAYVAAFVKTPALPTNLIIQWIEVG